MRILSEFYMNRFANNSSFHRMGSFILVDIRPHVTKPPSRPLYYPARVHARSGHLIQLAWFHGNMYAGRGGRPTAHYFTMNANDCLTAHQSIFHAREAGAKGGTIAIPPLLDEDSVDRGAKYRDPSLLTALHQASGELLDIIQGKKDHLLWTLFHRHWQCLPKTRVSQKQLLFAYEFSMDFNFPLFPANDATALLFVRNFEAIVMKTPGASNVHNAIVHELAAVFFRAVAVRHHLGLPPSNDRLLLLLSYRRHVPPNSKLRNSLSAVERDALDGRLVRHASEYELVQKSFSGKVAVTRCIQLHLSEAFTSAESPIHAEMLSSHQFVFPPGHTPPPQPFEALPPLPVEFREVKLYNGPPRFKPKARPAGTTARPPAPPPVILLDSSPVWWLLGPSVEEAHELQGDEHRREDREDPEDPENSEDPEYTEHASNAAKRKRKKTLSEAPQTRKLRARNSAGVAVTQKRKAAPSSQMRPARRRRVGERYITVLEDAEGRRYELPDNEQLP